LKKAELLKECFNIFKTQKVSKWYTENLESKSQSETLKSLEKAVVKNELTIYEALAIALIVGIQWYEKFEGVP